MNNLIFKKWAKDLNRHVTKENIQMENKYEKMLNIICEANQKDLITIHLLEWPKSRT